MKALYIFRTDQTKMKAMMRFKENEKIRLLAGYLIEEDGNGIELFEKIYDR